MRSFSSWTLIDEAPSKGNSNAKPYEENLVKPYTLRAAITAGALALSAAAMAEIEAVEPAPLVDPTHIGSLKGESAALPDLTGIVRNKEAAIALGKALFFDINAGSDGQACASCHFAAGADNRITNQLNPGENDLRGTFGWGGGAKDGIDGNGLMIGGGVAASNQTLTEDDFPLHKLKWKNNRKSKIESTTNDVVGSQGTHAGSFLGLGRDIDNSRLRQDRCGDSDATVFGDGTNSHRKVSTRNAPTTINAVFNHRNFWDGRANNVFNGVDGTGKRNENARLIVNGDTGAELYRMELKNASLASQAVGPILSSHEMSCDNRSFVAVARKLLPIQALRDQAVSKTDSALGSYAVSDGLGLTKKYSQLIKKAFDPKWYNASGKFSIDTSTGSPVLTSGKGTSQMISNFPMFWGISIMLWEAELISDDSPVDRYFDGTGELSESEALGMSVFLGKGKCVACHSTAAYSRATTLYLTGTEEEAIERMDMAKGKDGSSTPAALYDAGFYNIGVTPTVQDVGLGAFDQFGYPLSFTRQYVAQLMGQKTGDSINIDACTMEVRFGEDVRGFDDYITNRNMVGCEGIDHMTLEPLTDTFTPRGRAMVSKLRVAVDGAFKTPTVRNVGLTAPYFHNGGYKNLEELVEFYNRGGNRRGDFQISQDGRAKNKMPKFDRGLKGDTSGSGWLGGPVAKNTAHVTKKAKKGSNLDANIVPLNLTQQEQDGLVDFMLALTDERVACMKAPFDQPALPLYKGQTGAKDNADWDGPRSDDNRDRNSLGGAIAIIPATGAGGLEAIGQACLSNTGNLFDARNVMFGETIVTP